MVANGLQLLHNSYGIEGEDADPFHRRVFGDGAPVEATDDAAQIEEAG